VSVSSARRWIAGRRNRRGARSEAIDVQLIDAFHRSFYESEAWKNAYWLGVPTQKYPSDLWIYQELLYELKPDVIVETGTLLGGSALFLASMCDLLGNGRVISVDIEVRKIRGQPARDLKSHIRTRLRPHPRIAYVQGFSSASPQALKAVRAQIRPGESVMVILDSDHREAHVVAELHAYADLVTPNHYLIVEDTCVNGHPVNPEHGPGPMEAVNAFLKERSDFKRDRGREKFHVTANPGGVLRRLR
jgi:cephalosporin hydroxylase